MLLEPAPEKELLKRESLGDRVVRARVDEKAGLRSLESTPPAPERTSPTPRRSSSCSSEQRRGIS